MASAILSRSDSSVLSQWWWRVDRITFFCVIALLSVGVLMVMAASSPVAERVGLGSMYFVKRHLIYVVLSAIGIILISMQSSLMLRRFALVVFICALLATYLTPLIGSEIKGARRWLSLGPLSVQPSEFLKPTLVVLTAWMLSEKKKNIDVPGNIFALVFYVLVAVSLLLQPDMGMLVLVTATFFFQFFLSGLPLMMIGLCGLLGGTAVIASYFLFPHVQARVDRFMAPPTADRFSDRYQINQSLDAFTSGGFWGLGPGEGVVKKHLPDSHADFIFSVLGEEFGVVACAALVVLIALMVVRPMMLQAKSTNLFQILCVTGLCAQLGMQSFINMASTLDLIPTKGMTLPFISFGGSSLLAAALTMGFVLGFLKREGPREGLRRHAG